MVCCLFQKRRALNASLFKCLTPKTALCRGINLLWSASAYAYARLCLGPWQKFSEARWNKLKWQNSFGRVGTFEKKKTHLKLQMVFCIHFGFRVGAWSANFCSFRGEGGVSSETNFFFCFTGLLRSFAMAPYIVLISSKLQEPGNWVLYIYFFL